MYITYRIVPVTSKIYFFKSRCTNDQQNALSDGYLKRKRKSIYYDVV